MPTTDQQVKSKKEQVEALRAQIASADSEIARLQRERANDSVMEGLASEEARLKIELEDRVRQIEHLGGDTKKISQADEKSLPAVPAQASKADTSTSGKG